MSDGAAEEDDGGEGGIAPFAAVWGATGAISALIGVLAGAFGAHALRDHLEPRLLDVFETAARYQLMHALALIGVAWAFDRTVGPLVCAAGWCFAAGTVLFSGSLYALALTGVRVFGAVTPLGGLAFMAGWACLAAGLWSARAR